MQHLLRQCIPSMFQRRLLLLAAVATITTVVMGLRLTQLTITEGEFWQAEAESALVARRLIQTQRGRILDRNLKVLAEDRPSYDLAVAYPLIIGSWAFDRAKTAAYESNRQRWAEISKAARLKLVESHQIPFDEQVQNLWSTFCEVGHIDRAELALRLHTIKQRVQRMVSVVHMARLRRWQKELEGSVSREEVAGPISEQQAHHPVLRDLDDRARLVAERLITSGRASAPHALWAQVSVVPSQKRHYPCDMTTLSLDLRTLPAPLRKDQTQLVTVHGTGIHLIGALRRCWREIQQRRFDQNHDLGGYLPGDLAGDWGLERAFEAHLRGERGRVVTHRNTSGSTRSAPAPGRDVISTIDIALQARVQALMDPSLGLMRIQEWHSNQSAASLVGMPLRGAAVVLEVAQGQVLAAVSVPTFTREQWREDAEMIRNNSIDRPFWYRPIAMPYQPGSTVKPLVLTMAVTDRKLRVDQTIYCRGHLLEDHSDRYRCWIYKLFNIPGHKHLDGAHAIGHSCNIFFYTLGRRLGAQQLVRWYGRFGLGHRSGCGLLEETAGVLPDLSRANDPSASGFTTSSSVFMGIGQGPLRWTALQAADSFATLARGGYRLRPSFVSSPTVDDLGEQPSNQDLRLDPDGVAMAMKGLYLAANNPIFGTAHHLSTPDREQIFNIPGVTIWAKTGTATAATNWMDRSRNGTADAGKYWVDLNTNGTWDDGEQVPATDHAWCIAMVRSPKRHESAFTDTRSDYVVAVVAEYAGSGGRVAGPIANQILHALRAEGYL